jgi:hypothetical protein
VRRIFKFPLDDYGYTPTVMMQSDAKILCVQVQEDVMVIYAEVEPLHAMVERQLHVVNTGNTVPRDAEYIGTVMRQHGQFVHHIYIESEPL